LPTIHPESSYRSEPLSGKSLADGDTDATDRNDDQTYCSAKIAAIALTLWKKEERFDGEQLKPQAA